MGWAFQGALEHAEGNKTPCQGMHLFQDIAYDKMTMLTKQLVFLKSGLDWLIVSKRTRTCWRLQHSLSSYAFILRQPASVIMHQPTCPFCLNQHRPSCLNEPPSASITLKDSPLLALECLPVKKLHGTVGLQTRVFCCSLKSCSYRVCHSMIWNSCS